MVFAYITYTTAALEIEQKAMDNLVSVARSKTRYIINYLETEKNNVVTLASSPYVVSAMKKYATTFDRYGMGSDQYIIVDLKFRRFLSAKAISGQRDFGISYDYRNKEVLAAWDYLPEFNWGIVVKIDTSESLAQVYFF